MKKNIGKSMILAMLCISIALAALTIPALASTEVTITKYDPYGTVLDTETVTCQWMMENLPVQGDGVTHYYFQGPTFNPDILWDTTESINVGSRDYGACMGTDVKDLCDLVGGAPLGSEVEIKARDNFAKNFAAEDINNPEPEQGKLVITWYVTDHPDPRENRGYVWEGTYTKGPRLIFFADDSTNPWGWHVFGAWNMHETLAEEYWHYYYHTPTEKWPSSSGLSVKYVNQINIYTSCTSPIITATADANGSIEPSGEVMVDFGTDQTFTITPDPGYAVADVLVDGDSVGAVTSYTFTKVNTAHTIAASFEVTYASLSSLVEQVVTQDGIVNSLLSKLDAAEKANNANAKAGVLGAFINEVEAQTGKSISEDDAALLICLANQL